MKAIFFKILKLKPVAYKLLPYVLKAHNLFYDLASMIAVTVNHGEHPKHSIMLYKEWFLSHVDSSSIVLDVGSNTGAMSSLMAKKAKYVYGIEIDAEHASEARARYSMPNLEFVTGDATSYSYKGFKQINCVTLSNVLEHIEDRINFLKNLQREVPWSDNAPRLFLIRVPSIERDWISVYKKLCGVEYRLDSTHKIEHTQQLLHEELLAAGLQIVSFETRFGEYYLKCYGNQ